MMARSPAMATKDLIKECFAVDVQNLAEEIDI